MTSDLVFSVPQLQEERQRLDRRQAIELFAPLYSTPFTRVEISGCSVPDEAAIVAAKGLQALAKKRCLRELVLSDCIAGLPTDEALKSLTTLCEAIGTWKGLRSVDFSSNALGSRGVAACSAVLKDQPLEEVLFSNNGLAAPSIKLIRNYLCHDKETELKVFHCTLNCIQSAGFLELVEIVKCSPKLQEIKFSSLRSEADATLQLCTSLQVFDDLRVLDISDNAVNEEGALALGIALKKQTKLEILMLRDLALTDEELSTILEPLVEAKPPLDVLDLSGNEISGEGCALVVDVMRTFSDSLRTLLLADNEVFDSGTLRLANALSLMDTTVLQHLALSCNMIRDFAAVTIAEEVFKLPDFEKLDLDENYISEKTITAIQKCLGDMLESVDKMVPEDERDDVDKDEPANEGELEAAVERLAAATRPQSPSVPSLISKFEGISVSEVGSSATDTTLDQPSTVVESARTEVTSSMVTGTSFESPRANVASSSSRQSGDTSAPEGETEVPFEIRSAFGAGSSRNQVYSSAQKLNRDLEDIKQSLTGFVSELNEINSETVPQRLSFGDSNGNLLADLDRADKQNKSSMLLDILGGFLVAVFVVVLVLSVAKSQEETTYSYRLV